MGLATYNGKRKESFFVGLFVQFSTQNGQTPLAATEILKSSWFALLVSEIARAVSHFT